MNVLSDFDFCSQAAMDSARLSAAKSSPMMETINMCLQYLDVSVLGELVPRLCELIRSGVGLGTKVSKCIFHKE